MTVYIIQVVIIQLGFLLLYELLLKSSTFFNWNRGYLLLTLSLSFILPFIQIEIPVETNIYQNHISLPEVLVGVLEPMTQNLNIENTIQSNSNKLSIPYLLIIIIIGILISAYTFLLNLLKILNLKNKNTKQHYHKVCIVKHTKEIAPFSFFNTIFINKKITEKEFNTILKHELVHVKHKHSLDLILLSILKIFFWFNPLLYIYKKRLELLHEYTADREAVISLTRSSYINQLLNHAFETQNMSFVNSFFKTSLIKDRIKMLQSASTRQVHLLKFLLVIPLLTCFLYFTSITANSQVKSATQIENQQQINEEELVKKYYDELVKIDDFDKVFESTNETMQRSKTIYIKSFEDHCRIKALFLFIQDETKKRKQKKETWTEEDESNYNERVVKSKNYQEYLEYSKTLESKLNWESRTEDGILKLVVDDLKNYTEEEQKRYDKKMKMIENDEFFTGLIICQTDGKGKTFFGEENNKVTEVKSLKKSDVTEIPFAVIEDAPTTKECKDASFDERKKCLSIFISKFVAQNFNMKVTKETGLKGRQRIMVNFKIDTNGFVKDVRARAPHPDLEVESKRVINLLPQFIPGKQKGKTVIVPYSLPIVFEVK